MAEARSIECDRVEIAVGISPRGTADVLMMPILAGSPLLSGPISMTPEIARTFARELLAKADAAEAYKRPN